MSALSVASSTINQFDADGGLGTCKLKAYPPRFNGAITLGFVPRFLDVTQDVQADDCTCAARRTVLDCCLELEADNSISELVEQDLSIGIPEGHDLHQIAQWPDRHADIGKDFAFYSC